MKEVKAPVVLEALRSLGGEDVAAWGRSAPREKQVRPCVNYSEYDAAEGQKLSFVLPPPL